MINLKCKICRRSGEKLFLKEEKCFSPKCPITRKPYPPGNRKSSSSRKPKRAMSEYGAQLREKQKMKFLYFLRERQFKNYVQEALKAKKSDIISKFVELLEMRLDNVVFRSGLAKSRSMARQMVSHGHVLVNDKKSTIPSCKTRIGDRLSIKQASSSKGIFQDHDHWFKKYEAPAWLKVDKIKKESEVVNKPQTDSIQVDANLNAIIEFYSR